MDIVQMIIKTFKNRTTIIAAILIALYTVTGFFLLPFLIGRYLPGMLGERINCDVSLKQVKVNPFALSLEATDFQVKDPSGMSIAGFQRLYVNFQLSSLFRWALTFADLTIDGPSVNIVIDADGKVNLAQLASNESPGPAQKKGTPLRLILRNIGITQGRIDVTDNRQSTPAGLSFYPLNIKLSDISTLPNRKGPYTLAATCTDGSTVKWSGQVSLQPLHSEGTIAFEQIPLSTPWSFFRSALNIASPKGTAGLKTNYLFDYSKDAPEITLDSLNLIVSDLALKIEGDEKAFIDLAEINLEAGRLDLVQQKIDNLGLLIKDGDLDLITDTAGVLNLERITGQKTGHEGASPPPASTRDNKAPWIIDIPSVELEDIALNYTDQAKTRPVSYSIDALQLVFNASVNTDAPGIQVKVNGLDMTLRGIALGLLDSSQPALQIGSLDIAGGALDLGARSASVSGIALSDGEIDVILDRESTINLAQMFISERSSRVTDDKTPGATDGNPWQYLIETASMTGFKTSFTDMTVKPDSPLIVLEDISLTVSHFDGKAPSPFEIGMHVAQGGDLAASGKLNPADTTLTSDITIKGLSLTAAQPYLSRTAEDLTLKSGIFFARGTFNRTAKGGMSYKGEIGIAGLSIVENSTNDTLVGWEELKTPGLNLGQSPDRMEMDTLKLTGLEGKLIISEDKTVNVVEAFKTKEPATAEPQSEEPSPSPNRETTEASFPIKIGRLNIEKGNLYFADLSLRPQFGTKIHELTGVIIGISSTPGARTQVELEGHVDEYGSNNIKGEINTFDPKQFTDISVVFKNVEMTNLTPYSGKFAGYKIDSGKLDLDLQYKIENSQLLGQNKIVIDTMTLGEKVESPDAVKLPLKLAVAILKDSNGVIDLDLPVTGDLNDPEFKYGPLIWKAVVNLLTKIVTSPFRALGALIGGEEEILNTVGFEAGSGDVPPLEQEKLDKLLDALRQRPQLKLIVTGHYNNAFDGAAIKELQVRRAVAEANGMTLEPGEDPGPVDFSNPLSQQRLKEMLIERYGQDTYDTLNPTPTPVEEETSKKGGKKKADAKHTEPPQPPEDPGDLAKRLFNDLVKKEQVETAVLKELADKRAQAIAALMTGADGLPADRVAVKPSEGTDKGEISAALDLAAMD